MKLATHTKSALEMKFKPLPWNAGELLYDTPLVEEISIQGFTREIRQLSGIEALAGYTCLTTAFFLLSLASLFC